MKVSPVILAGGEGTRLWPLSRKNHPKQFLRLFGEHSLLQETLLRIHTLRQEATLESPLVICNEEYRFVVQEHADEIGETLQNIILEPVGRNTAPALTLAALLHSQDTVLLMMPADHLVRDKEGFTYVMHEAVTQAETGRIVTLGMRPGGPDTGYGYIRKGAAIDAEANVFELQKFVEKPDLATARRFCNEGDYLWNSGIFAVRSSVWLEAVQTLQPDIVSHCTAALERGRADDLFFHLQQDEFTTCPADSVDYAVMERIDELAGVTACVISADVGWSDIGAWDKVWEQGAADNNNNVTSGDVLLTGSRDSLVRAESRMVTAIGCNNLAIIETADAVMVMDKKNSQDIRQLVKQLQDQGRGELQNSTFVHRPWGGYESIQTGPGYQIKRLLVKPGRKLSLQSHEQRSEHWVVIRGQATVTRDNKVEELKVNESTYIATGVKHRLANESEDVLEVIEVQVGSYLGEDDIERYEDDFGRV